MKTNFYLHNTADMGDLRENVEDEDLSPEAKEQLAEDLYSLFYEVAFDIEYDSKTGKVTKVALQPTRSHQQGIFQL